MHSDSERQAIDKFVQEERVDRVVVLDQGSRPGRIVIGFKDVEEDKDGTGLQDEKGRPGKMPLLLIDHHQSEAVSLKIPGKISLGDFTNSTLYRKRHKRVTYFAIHPNHRFPLDYIPIPTYVVPTRGTRSHRLQFFPDRYNILVNLSHLFATSPTSTRSDELGCVDGSHWRLVSRRTSPILLSIHSTKTIV